MNAKIEKEADRVFSIYIRNLNSVNGICTCITCKRTFPISEIDNGHFCKRGNHATRYEEDNCRPQCIECNRGTENKDKKFREELIKIKGLERVEELERLSRSVCKISDSEGREIIKDYKNKLRELLKERLSK